MIYSIYRFLWTNFKDYIPTKTLKDVPIHVQTPIFPSSCRCQCTCAVFRARLREIWCSSRAPVKQRLPNVFPNDGIIVKRIENELLITIWLSRYYEIFFFRYNEIVISLSQIIFLISIKNEPIRLLYFYHTGNYLLC